MVTLPVFNIVGHIFGTGDTIDAAAPRGTGAPLPSFFLLVYSIPHLLLFLLFPFLICFAYFLLLSIPSFLLPESPHSVSRPEVVGGDQTWL